VNQPTRQFDRVKAARRRLRRGAKRGAVLVEALIVIPFFAIIFIMLIHMGKMYVKKLHAISQTKACVWERAMSGNCESGCGQAQVSDLGDADLDMGSEMNPSQGHPQVDDWLTRTFKETKFRLDDSNTAANAFGQGGFTNRVYTTQTVMCNEKPENGQWRSIFLFTYHKLTGW